MGDNSRLKCRDNQISITMQSAAGRTYGECVQIELDSINLISGKFIATVSIPSKPKRMKKQEALVYYKEKLRSCWATLS